MSEIARRMAEVYAPRRVASLPAHLGEAYGVKVARVSQLDGGVCRVDRDDGPPWVARVFSDGRPLDRAAGDAALLRELAELGFPAERIAAGDGVSVLDGQPVVVTEFVEGPAPDTTVASLTELADLLGRLHATDAASDGATRPGGSLHHVPGYEGAPREDLALAVGLLDDVEPRISRNGRDAFARLKQDVEEADDCGDLPHALLHPDPVLKNAVATPGGIVLIDWTGAGRGPRVTSVAVLLGAAMKPGGWDAAKIEAMAGAYQAHVRLEPGEVARLGAAMRIRQLWLAAWQYWVATASGHPPTGNEWWMPSAALTDALVKVAAPAFA